jgi:transmembrane protein EpsG
MFLSLNSSFSEVISAEAKDKGFSIFTFFLKQIIGNDDTLYFIIIAAICLMCVASVYKKHSCNFMMSMFLFIASSDYVQWTYNGMRQFIAVSVLFAASDLLLRRKYIKYYGLILLMSTVHASALIMIPVSLVVLGRPWNMRTVVFTIAILIAINFSGTLRNMIADFMSETQYGAEVKQFLETEGTNVLRVLVFCIPPVLALVFKRYLLAVSVPIIDLSTNMAIVSMGMYIVSAVTSGVIIGRIPIYFSLYNYILLPWLVENVFEKKSHTLVYSCLIVCYLVFYWYQMTVAWDFSAYV